ncbi:MAG TPA: cytidine deaminase [Pyrinomonadaceae bacterium]|jgi:cytidine deaminase
MEKTDQELIEAARAVRARAHAPFSGFKVGAALETESGDVVTGCNVENASYGLTMCAERVAIFKAISEGEKQFARLAVVADTEELTPPCGACRQIIWEFCGDIPVIMSNLNEKTETVKMSELLPRAFDANFLK